VGSLSFLSVLVSPYARPPNRGASAPVRGGSLDGVLDGCLPAKGQDVPDFDAGVQVHRSNPASRQRLDRGGYISPAWG
jgi:hypothetical protein